MTIGYVIDDTLDRSDGVQQAVISIGEKMRSIGHDVHYIVPKTTRTDLANIHVVARYVSLQFNGNSVRTPLPAQRRKIKKLLGSVHFDVLHIQMPYSPLLAGKVIRLSSQTTKKFGTFHILPYDKKAVWGTKLLRRMLWRSLPLVRHFYATSRPALHFMQESFKVPGEVLPNPVDVGFYDSFTKQNNPNGKKRIVFLGRFEQRKGVRELLLAYELLDPKTRSLAELTMCGKGPLLDELKSFAEQRQLDVHFPGFVSEQEKAQYLTNADIAVFPSISGESFGIVLVEAMAAHAGIVLGGNNPGYASVLEPWPQVLFNPHDVEALAQKLTYYINDDADRIKDGNSQYAASKQYDVNVVVQKLIEAYSG